MPFHSYLAIIPARAGSKGIKNKNVSLLAGKPLISYSIEAALSAHCFEEIVITTDCEKVKHIAQEYPVTIIDRPSELSTDLASSLDVITHALNVLAKDNKLSNYFMLLQPTSPLRTSSHIKNAVEQLEKSQKQTLVSISYCEDSPFKTLIRNGTSALSPIRNWSDLTQPRQALPKAYKPNGAIYIAETNSFLDDQILFNKHASFFEMDKESSLDIDAPLDLFLAEHFIRQGK